MELVSTLQRRAGREGVQLEHLAVSCRPSHTADAVKVTQHAASLHARKKDIGGLTWTITMWAVLVCVGFLSTWAAASSNLPLVHRLSADPDFRDVTLRWLYDRSAPKLYGFQVNYCELQAWGPYRCRTKLVDDSTGRVLDNKYRRYSVIISGLRMSTNYSFQVLPFEAGGAWDAEKDSDLLIVSTRGFSARAKECLPRASEVEVATGPYFGGRIAVEAADGARCAVDGDPTSPRDTYILHINHEKCGTHVNETTVATFVLVQENLPILTHSTRRFLVVCSFQPETLTVRAGINLPRHRHKEEPTNDNRVDVMPYEAESAESVNDVQMSHLQRHQMLVETEMDRLQQEESTMQLVLMLLLAVAFVVGSVFTAWWFIKRRRSSKSNTISSEETSSATYENFENSLWENSMTAAEEGVSTIQDTSEDSVSSGVFTITIPSPLVSEDDRPCIVIESNSQSEA